MNDKKVPNHTDRLVNLQNFINVICIGGNGYDLKDISRKITYGIYDYRDAVEEWLIRGQYLLYSKEEALAINENKN